MRDDGSHPDGSDPPKNAALAERVDELADVLERLESEVADRDDAKSGGLVRFTREVTIPAAILVLRTNIEALQLLQRALALADGDPPRGRAEEAGRSAVEGLEETLEGLSKALSGRPVDSRSQDLLAEARNLRAEIEGDLKEQSMEGGREAVDINVESELESIKDDIEDGSPDQSTGSNR